MRQEMLNKSGAYRAGGGPLITRKVGSGRKKGSISFVSMTRRDMEKLLAKFPKRGKVIVSRRWVQSVKELGLNIPATEPVLLSNDKAAQKRAISFFDADARLSGRGNW